MIKLKCRALEKKFEPYLDEIKSKIEEAERKPERVSHVKSLIPSRKHKSLIPSRPS